MITESSVNEYDKAKKKDDELSKNFQKSTPAPLEKMLDPHLVQCK